ncbi:MAG: hypothetical protein J5382_10320 [Bacteroidales bacterium]|nr:hypothetical protein [Bacteroidales bacterium]
MKTLFCLFAFLLFPIFACNANSCQPDNGLHVLDTARFVNIRVDYSKASIDGLKEGDLIRIGTFNWEKGKQEILERFERAMNRKDFGVNIYYSYENPDCRLYITFFPITISRNGDVFGYAVIHNDIDTYDTISDIYGKGGKFGTFINLIGDGMESVGMSLSWYINECVSYNRKVAERERRRQARRIR